MADYQQNFSLEEQLRQDRRLAANHRRRKRMRWMIPLGLALLSILLLIAPLLRKARQEQEPAQETLAPSDAAAVLAFVGDISMDEAQIEAFRAGDGFDFTPLFRRVTAQLTAADLTLGNLEGNISDGGGDHVYPASLLSALYACGFDVLQTANSYSIQNGISGLAETKAAIEQAGMSALGTFASPEEREQSGGVTIREVNGIRFALIGFTKGMNNLRLPEGSEYSVNLLYRDYDTNYTRIDTDAIVQTIDHARELSPDVIIAMVHWGSEYTQEVSEAQKKIAELMFDNGVNLIVGSHSHYVATMEPSTSFLTKNTFAAYGLGDFVSASDTFSARAGCILTVRFVKHGQQTSMREISYTPTFSAAPRKDLDISAYEVLNTLDAVTFYESGYYDRVSEAFYEKLVESMKTMGEQTGAPELQADR